MWPVHWWRSADEERRRQAKATRAQGNRDFPAYGALVSSIEAFAADLATVRVVSLTTGYAQQDAVKASAKSSVRALGEAIRKHRAEIVRRLPPLALILDDLNLVAESFAVDSLFDDQGHEALANLAQHYVQLERYPEAAIVAREGHVNCYAAGATAVDVNGPHFDEKGRRDAERRFALDETVARTVADVRNDIQHGGFRKQPLNAGTLRNRVKDLSRRLCRVAQVPAQESEVKGRTLFVSRHPGALEWAAAKGLQVDGVVEHLDVEELQAGDTVIGSLPVNLAALACQRGARYFHLAVSPPAHLRGRELSAVQLSELDTRLVEYEIKQLSHDTDDK